jgi:hypothetical protein
VLCHFLCEPAVGLDKFLSPTPNFFLQSVLIAFLIVDIGTRAEPL